jgi:phosphomannomutase
MNRIKELAQKVDVSKPAHARGKILGYDGVFRDYSEFVSTKIKLRRKLKVVADASNGVCGLFAPSLFRAQGCEILTLNEKPDGRFPAHQPEPKESTLGELKNQVVATKADYGVGFDGDGDRAVFVDEKGRTIPGDLALLVFAKDVFERERGAKVVCELSCSLAVEEYVNAQGGVPITERVGHTFIMERMLSEQAALGGEKSGHFYFFETNGGDDALFASLRMAEILSKSRVPLSVIFDSFPQYPSIHGESFPCPDDLQSKVMERLKSKFKSERRNFLDIDGIKLLNEIGWVLIRPSNTEPVIRVTAEAKTKNGLQELYAFAKTELTQALKECQLRQ